TVTGARAGRARRSRRVPAEQRRNRNGQLLPRRWSVAPAAAASRAPAGAVPRIANRIPNVMPGGAGVDPVLVAVPPGFELGFDVLPGAIVPAASCLKAVAIGGPEALVVVGADRVGTAREVLVPEVVLGFPRGLPGGVDCLTVHGIGGPTLGLEPAVTVAVIA